MWTAHSGPFLFIPSYLYFFQFNNVNIYNIFTRKMMLQMMLLPLSFFFFSFSCLSLSATATHWSDEWTLFFLL